MRYLFRYTLSMLLLAAPLALHAQKVTRYELPDSDLPIAAAVEVPAGKATVYACPPPKALRRQVGPLRFNHFAALRRGRRFTATMGECH